MTHSTTGRVQIEQIWVCIQARSFISFVTLGLTLSYLWIGVTLSPVLWELHLYKVFNRSYFLSSKRKQNKNSTVGVHKYLVTSAVLGERSASLGEGAEGRLAGIHLVSRADQRMVESSPRLCSWDFTSQRKPNLAGSLEFLNASREFWNEKYLGALAPNPVLPDWLEGVWLTPPITQF